MVRYARKSTQVLIDLVVLSLALWIAFAVRFEGEIPTPMLHRLLVVWPAVVALQYGVLAWFGVPRFAWRYVGLREAVQVTGALGATFLLLLAFRLYAGVLGEGVPLVRFVLIPIGVLLIDHVLAYVGILGTRALWRIRTERRQSHLVGRKGQKSTRTFLVGAGQAGLLIAKEIASRPDLGVEVVGFIDDDPNKLGMTVHGIPVRGTMAQLEILKREFSVEQVIITISNAPGRQIRSIQRRCRDAGLGTKIIPGVFELVGGQVSLSRMRDVSIEDLLRRDPVTLETDEISRTLRGRVVLVTGAGGSIGSELCRQICRFAPMRLVLFEQAENSVFNIHRELIASFPELAEHIVPCVGDVCDLDRLELVFGQHQPEVVFHAAAHKHVPMMEWNPGEAVRNNVLGSRRLADASHAHGVDKFVMISTDKAVNPTSVMGATKRVAEIYIQTLGRTSRTRFSTVRFGNVLGSAGSVIPIFREQIEKGGPVQVTHPEMTRYFMTIPEACQLVLQAGSLGNGGEIFLLDMGEPVKIVDLANDLITLSGLVPNEDIEIVFTGLRPGEKLFEELSVAEESVDRTRHPKIFIGRVRENGWDQVVRGLAELEAVVSATEAEVVRSALMRLVPEYHPVVPASVSADRPRELAAMVSKPAVAG